MSTKPVSAKVTPPPRRKYAGKDAQTRQAERRDKLVQAGMTLFGRDGFAATSIDALCAEAGLTKRYFYESFASSEELLTQTYKVATQDLIDTLMRATSPHLSDSRTLAYTGVEEVFRFVRNHPHKARLIMIEATSVRGQLGRMYGKSYGTFVDLLVNFTKPFLPDDGPSDTILAVMARGAVGAIVHLCQVWLANGCQQPMEELVEGVQRIFGGMGRELGVPGWVDSH